MGQNNVFDNFIVMDNVFRLADKSDDFAKPTCMFFIRCTLQDLAGERLSQTKIFNIFAGSLQTASVVNILSSYCNRYTNKYIPHRDLWLNRLYFEISNSSEKSA